MFQFRQDLFVPAARMWLDPKKPRHFAFVSHAHGDHIARHEHALATPATARLMEHRLGDLRIQRLPFAEPLQLNADVQVTLYPAGHILGAAQIALDVRGERLVYTGDFRLKKSATADLAQIVPCDVLIMECTFGRPHYQFPPREDVLPELVETIRQLLRDGQTPVLLAYSLGRSQELLSLLRGEGLRFFLAPPIYFTVKVYEELGVSLGEYEMARPGRVQGGVLMVPPHASRSRLVKRAERPVLLAATGWARDGAPPYPADRCFPFSDHADFDELLEYVEKAAPREVYVINGFEDFCEHLRARGVRAYPASTKVAVQ
jgi:Cft2 family RNA processing exonuclease